MGSIITGSESDSRSVLERTAGAGESPVGDIGGGLDGYPSKIGHVKPGPNPRGPSRKAQYDSTTDSEPSRATERWEEPRQGRTLNLKPRAYKRWEGDAFGPPDRVPFA